MTRRFSAQATAVLRALAGDPQRWRHGYELGQEVNLKAGSLYPILIRLHDQGLLDSAWEEGPHGGRPPRHLYRLSGKGVRAAAQLPAPHAAVSAPAVSEAPAATRRPATRPTHRTSPGTTS